MLAKDSARAAVASRAPVEAKNGKVVSNHLSVASVGFGCCLAWRGDTMHTLAQGFLPSYWHLFRGSAGPTLTLYASDEGMRTCWLRMPQGQL